MQWFTAGKSVEYSAAFSGRNFIAGVDRQKTEMVDGMLVGIAVSFAIEISQLLLCRGLFEFDDIIHNSLGCMLGCLLGNRMLRLVHGK